MSLAACGDGGLQISWASGSTCTAEPGSIVRRGRKKGLLKSKSQTESAN